MRFGASLLALEDDAVLPDDATRYVYFARRWDFIISD